MTFGTCHPCYAGGPIPSPLFSKRDSSSLRLGKKDSAPSIPPFLEGRCDDATCRFTHVAARTFASIPKESLSGSLDMGIAPPYLAPHYSGEQGIPEVALSATSHESSTAHFPALRAPAHFSPRVMRPIVPELLSAMAKATAYSIASSQSPDASKAPWRFGLHLDVYPPTQILQINRCFYHFTSASHFVEGIMCSRAPSLHGRYPASSLLRTQPPPSRLQTLSRCYRLYALPCSTDFSTGRGRLLQLLSVSLSPCHPYHPAGVSNRIGQGAVTHIAFASRE